MSAEAPISMEALSPATVNLQPLTATEDISAVVQAPAITPATELAPTPTQFLAQQESIVESPATLTAVLQTVEYVPRVMDGQFVQESPASVEVLGWPEYVPESEVLGHTLEASDAEEETQLDAVRAELLTFIDDSSVDAHDHKNELDAVEAGEAPEIVDEFTNTQSLIPDGESENLAQTNTEQEEALLEDTEDVSSQASEEVDDSLGETGKEAADNEDETSDDAETEDQVAGEEEMVNEDTEDEEEQSQRRPDQSEDEEGDKQEQLPPPPVYSFDSAAAGERRRRLEEALETQRDRRTGPIPGSMVAYAIDPSDGSLMSAALKTASQDPSVPKPSTDRSLVDTLSLVASAQNVTTDTIYSAVMSSKPVQEGSGDPVSEVEVINVVGPGAYSRRRRGVA